MNPMDSILKVAASFSTSDKVAAPKATYRISFGTAAEKASALRLLLQMHQMPPVCLQSAFLAEVECRRNVLFDRRQQLCGGETRIDVEVARNREIAR